MSSASEMNLAKLPPFHENVQKALSPMRLVGIQGDAIKQGEALALLALTLGSEIPAPAIPEVIKTCKSVKACLEAAMPTATGIRGAASRVVFKELLRLADAAIENLPLRIQAKANAASTRPPS